MSVVTRLVRALLQTFSPFRKSEIEISETKVIEIADYLIHSESLHDGAPLCALLHMIPWCAAPHCAVANCGKSWAISVVAVVAMAGKMLLQ